MSSARTPLPTLNERDTEQVRSPQGSPNSVAGPLHLAEPSPSALLVLLLPSASLGCPVIWPRAPVLHIPFPSPDLGPHLVLTELHTCTFAKRPSPLTDLLRSSELSLQLPLLFPFLSGAFLVFLHPRLKQPPSCSSNHTPRFAADCYPPLPASLVLYPLCPHRLSQSSVFLPQGSLSRSVFLVPILFHFPSFFYPPSLFQIGLSLLLATHQLHPRHLSKSFAYSLLITFPSFRQELPGSWHWHVSLPCFPYSCHAHSFPTGCLWGSSHRSLSEPLDRSCSLPPGVWHLSPWASYLNALPDYP